MPPQLRAQLDAYNTELFKNIQNEFTLTGFDLEQSQAIAQYNAQLQEFSSNLGRERLDQAAAGSAMDRSLAGLQESRQRADLITGALGSDYVRKYGVPTGSTGAFSAGDLGGASAGLAGFVGRSPDEVGIRYPGTATLDPEGLLAQYDAQSQDRTSPTPHNDRRGPSSPQRGAVRAVAVPDQIAGLLPPRRRLQQLTPHPRRCRMCRHVEMHEKSAAQSCGRCLARKVRQDWDGGGRSALRR